MSTSLDERPDTTRIFWLDYLRGLNILGTIIFHSFLAYSPFVQGLNQTILSGFPFLDNHAAQPLADLILLVRPLFSMQLMFFISGLFAWRGLTKKGSFLYLRIRAQRLLFPLIIVSLLLMPITFLPAQLIGQNVMHRLQFAHLWFLWVLFLFDCVLSLAFVILRNPIEHLVSRLNSLQIYLYLILAVLLSYWPLANIAGDSGWLPIFGPFVLPISRMGLYVVYFVAGVMMGSRCLPVIVQSTNWLSPFAPAASSTRAISLTALVPLVAFVICRLDIANLIEHNGVLVSWLLVNGLYAFAGLALVVGLIILSKRYLYKRNILLDNLAHNSYSIYLIHYTIVVWIQYILYGSSLSPSLRPWLVSIFSICISWFLADRLRRIPLINSFFVAS